jgi:hypothetical protein
MLQWKHSHQSYENIGYEFLKIQKMRQKHCRQILKSKPSEKMQNESKCFFLHFFTNSSGNEGKLLVGF